MRTNGDVRNGIGTYSLKSGQKRYRVVYRMNGRVKSKGGFVTKEAARRWQTKNASDVDTGQWIDPSLGRKTFGAFAGDWLPTVDVRPNTVALYDYLLRQHIYPTFEHTPLHNITTTAVRHWLADLRKKELSASTVAKAYRLFRRILTVAVDEKYLHANPANIKGAGKEDLPELHVPTADQVSKLADAVTSQYRTLVLVAGWGGLRWGEVTALRRCDVDLPNGCVHVRQQAIDVNGCLTVSTLTKTAAGRRIVYLPTLVLNALAQHLVTIGSGGEAVLFTAPRGGYLRRSRFRRDVWLPATTAVGCPGVRFHDLRHAAATLAAITGATTAELMQHMGHATAAAALRYQHATADRQRAIGKGLDALMPLQATGTDANVVTLPIARPRAGG
jgi:integrase